MYGTTWCSYCKKARSYFGANEIQYKEYDVENSEKGKRDYKKLGAKGIPESVKDRKARHAICFVILLALAIAFVRSIKRKAIMQLARSRTSLSFIC